MNALDLQRKIYQLHKNDEKVTAELLKTKYKKPYERLLSEIKLGVEEILSKFILSGILVRVEDKEAAKKIVDGIDKIIEQEQANGFSERIKHAIFKNYDLFEALDITYERINKKIMDEYYKPYFQEHCSIQEVDGKKFIWNDIIEMSWHEELGIWITGEDGSWSFMVMFEPPDDLRKGG